jgi:hypothetical protein
MVIEIMGNGGFEAKQETIKLAVEAEQKDKDSCC